MDEVGHQATVQQEEFVQLAVLLQQAEIDRARMEEYLSERSVCPWISDFRICAAQLTPFEQSRKLDAVDEITFCVDRCEDSGWLVASWDDPAGQGGITTQGSDLRELQEQVRDAVRCHFGEAQAPRRIRLHFVADPILAEA